MNFVVMTNLKILSSLSLLVALTGLFQIRLAIRQQELSSDRQDATKRPQAAIDYRYLKGGVFLLIVAALTQYFIFLFHF